MTTSRQPSDAEMRAELEELPPGHPSSPWNADGSRKPPPPRLADLELPLPGTWQDAWPNSGSIRPGGEPDGGVGAS